MWLAAIKRRHWIAIALLVGAAFGLAYATDEDPSGVNINGRGVLLADQQQFENGLVQDYNGNRLFSRPTVYSQWISDADGNKRRVDLVTGLYWDGHLAVRDGNEIADWLPRTFVALRPYRSTLTGMEYPSVLDFLIDVRHRYGVSFHYAWWATHPMLWSLALSLLLIGGIWPTVINLLVFGRLARPRNVRPTSLWSVVRPPETGTALQIETPVDQELAEEPAIEAARMAAEPPVGPAPTLTAGPLEPVPAPMHEVHEFAAKEDDFYPTELRAREKSQGA